MHSPTYKHGNYTKSMQIKLFTAYDKKIYRNCIKIHKNDEIDVKNASKI